MAKIKKSILIEAPVEKVFEFVTDFDNFLKASSPEIKMAVLSRDESPQKVGDIIKVKAKMGDQVFEADMETTEFVKNKKQVVRQKGGAFKKVVMTDMFEPADGGTKWISIMEYELPYSLLGKLIDKPKVRKEIEKGSDYYVNKTKELIEKE